VRVASHQPLFLPWAGYWHKVLSADVFVISAGVQWTNSGYLNRIRHDGFLLTVPVASHSSHLPINEVRIGDDANRVQAVKARVDELTRRMPHRWRLEAVIEALDAYEPGLPIAALNIDVIRLVAGILHAGTEIVVDAEETTGGSKTERLQQRVRRVAPDCTEYLAGSTAAATYLEPEVLGLPVRVQVADAFEGRSLLGLLGRESDPVDYLMTAGGWR
jgi:hypothetical protein